MDNRGNNRDSDRDGSSNRRGGNDRDERDQRREPSSSSPKQQRNEEVETTYYRSQIAPRSTNITSRVTPPSNNVIMEHFYSYGVGAGVPLKPGIKSAAVVAIQENREREKRELSHLNDRFASYIERVRFLEAQNKKLQLELEHLRGKWGSQTSKVKEMYEVEIREARQIIDDTSKDRAAAELRAKRAEEETSKLKDKYETLLAGRDSDRLKIEVLQKQLADNEADLNLFRRRLADLEDEQKRFRAESQKLILDIQRVTQDLDQETIARVQLENEKQSLEEEINFLKQIHAQEIEELKQANLIGTALDPANFFKHELSNAIRDIREEYEQLNNQQRNELESWYRLKVTQAVQEIQSRRAIEGPESARDKEEVKKLRTLVTDTRKDIAAMRQRNGELENRIHELEELVQIERREGMQATNERDREIQELRARLEELGRDYDELISTKSSLDAEIAIYRKLLEGEENRDGLKQIVTNVEEKARLDFASSGGNAAASSSHGSGGAGATSYSYSRSYRTTSGGQESEDHSNEHDAAGNRRTRENTASGGDYGGTNRSTTPSSTSVDNIRGTNDRHPPTIHEEAGRSNNAVKRLRDQGESGDRSSGGRTGAEGDDSSLEDPNERRDRSQAARKDEGYGQIRCGFRYDRTRGKLVVRILEARDLINTDKNSLSDPYVRILLLPDKRKKTKRRTKIMKDTLAPVFDETFEYDITYEEAKLKTIDVAVKNDRSLFSTEKVFMGQSLIPLANYNIDDGNLIDDWYTLEPEGSEIKVSPLTSHNFSQFPSSFEHRRRPAMISLNVQWVPVSDRSGTYRWNGDSMSSQRSKTVTFFGTGEMRGQKQSKPVTPPGSDYTDAYVAAFTPKSIPTRHVHHLSTSVFANAVPIPLKPPTTPPLSTYGPTTTSQTRLINIDNISASTSFDKSVPISSSRSSTYSSSFTSEKSVPYEPFSSSTQYSSPQSQTFTTSYSTLLRTPASAMTTIAPSSSVDTQRTYTTFQSRSQPSTGSLQSTSQTEVSYANLYKPMPSYSIQSYPPSATYTTSLPSSTATSSSIQSTYTPYVPFQSASMLSSSRVSEVRPNEPIIKSSEQMKKDIDRPETLVFQHDEDIRSTKIEQPSPAWSISPQSPMSRNELKIQPERLHMEEISSNSSEPIRILENTLEKYDALINQISEVLASVSPLSSTVSSMSPGKSVLDYQLSSDSSPILSTKHTHARPSEQLTAAALDSTQNTGETKPSHLIRKDSYDKILTTISDLEQQIISSSENEPSLTSDQRTSDETKILSTYEQQPPLISQQESEQLKVTLTAEQEISTPVRPEVATVLATADNQESLTITEEKVADVKVVAMADNTMMSILDDNQEQTKPSSFDEPQDSISSKQNEDQTTALSTDAYVAASTLSEYVEKEEKPALEITTQEQRQEDLSILTEEKLEHVQPSSIDQQSELSLTPAQEQHDIQVSSDDQAQNKETHEAVDQTFERLASDIQQIMEVLDKESIATVTPTQVKDTDIEIAKQEQDSMSIENEHKLQLVSSDSQHEVVHIEATEAFEQKHEQSDIQQQYASVTNEAVLSSVQEPEVKVAATPLEEQVTESTPSIVLEQKLEEITALPIIQQQDISSASVEMKEEIQVATVSEEQELQPAEKQVQSVEVVSEETYPTALKVEEHPALETAKETEVPASTQLDSEVKVTTTTTTVEEQATESASSIVSEQKQEETVAVPTGDQQEIVTTSVETKEEIKADVFELQQTPQLEGKQDQPEQTVSSTEQHEEVKVSDVNEEPTPPLKENVPEETKIELVEEIEAPSTISKEPTVEVEPSISVEQKQEESTEVSINEQQDASSGSVETKEELQVEKPAESVEIVPEEAQSAALKVEEQLSQPTTQEQLEDVKLETVKEIEVSLSAPLDTEVQVTTTVAEEQVTESTPSIVSEQKQEETVAVPTGDQQEIVTTSVETKEEIKADVFELEQTPQLEGKQDQPEQTVSSTEQHEEVKVSDVNEEPTPPLKENVPVETQVPSTISKEPTVEVEPSISVEQKEEESTEVSINEQQDASSGSVETKEELQVEKPVESVEVVSEEAQSVALKVEEQLSQPTTQEQLEDVKLETVKDTEVSLSAPLDTEVQVTTTVAEEQVTESTPSIVSEQKQEDIAAVPTGDQEEVSSVSSDTNEQIKIRTVDLQNIPEVVEKKSEIAETISTEVGSVGINADIQETPRITSEQEEAAKVLQIPTEPPQLSTTKETKIDVFSMEDTQSLSTAIDQKIIESESAKLLVPEEEKPVTSTTNDKQDIALISTEDQQVKVSVNDQQLASPLSTQDSQQHDVILTQGAVVESTNEEIKDSGKEVLPLYEQQITPTIEEELVLVKNDLQLEEHKQEDVIAIGGHLVLLESMEKEAGPNDIKSTEQEKEESSKLLIGEQETETTTVMSVQVEQASATNEEEFTKTQAVSTSEHHVASMSAELEPVNVEVPFVKEESISNIAGEAKHDEVKPLTTEELRMSSTSVEYVEETKTSPVRKTFEVSEEPIEKLQVSTIAEEHKSEETGVIFSAEHLQNTLTISDKTQETISSSVNEHEVAQTLEKVSQQIDIPFTQDQPAQIVIQQHVYTNTEVAQPQLIELPTETKPEVETVLTEEGQLQTASSEQPHLPSEPSPVVEPTQASSESQTATDHQDATLTLVETEGDKLTITQERETTENLQTHHDSVGLILSQEPLVPLTAQEQTPTYEEKGSEVTVVFTTAEDQLTKTTPPVILEQQQEETTVLPTTDQLETPQVPVNSTEQEQVLIVDTSTPQQLVEDQSQPTDVTTVLEECIRPKADELYEALKIELPKEELTPLLTQSEAEPKSVSQTLDEQIIETTSPTLSEVIDETITVTSSSNQQDISSASVETKEEIQVATVSEEQELQPAEKQVQTVEVVPEETYPTALKVEEHPTLETPKETEVPVSSQFDSEVKVTTTTTVEEQATESASSIVSEQKQEETVAVPTGDQQEIVTTSVETKEEMKADVFELEQTPQLEGKQDQPEQTVSSTEQHEEVKVSDVNEEPTPPLKENVPEETKIEVVEEIEAASTISKEPTVEVEPSISVEQKQEESTEVSINEQQDASSGSVETKEELQVEKQVESVEIVPEEAQSAALKVEAQLSQPTTQEQLEDVKLETVKDTEVSLSAPLDTEVQVTTTSAEEQVTESTPSIVSEQKEEDTVAVPTGDQQEIVTTSVETKEEMKADVFELEQTPQLEGKQDQPEQTVSSTEQHEEVKVSDVHEEPTPPLKENVPEEIEAASTISKEPTVEAEPSISVEQKQEESTGLSINEQQDASSGSVETKEEIQVEKQVESVEVVPEETHPPALTVGEHPALETAKESEVPVSTQLDSEVKVTTITVEEQVTESTPSIASEQKQEDIAAVPTGDQQDIVVASVESQEELKNEVLEEKQAAQSVREDEQALEPKSGEQYEETKKSSTSEEQSPILTETAPEAVIANAEDDTGALSTRMEHSITESEPSTLLEEKFEEITISSRNDEKPTLVSSVEQTEETQHSIADVSQISEVIQQEHQQIAAVCTYEQPAVAVVASEHQMKSEESSSNEQEILSKTEEACLSAKSELVHQDQTVDLGEQDNKDHAAEVQREDTDTSKLSEIQAAENVTEVSHESEPQSSSVADEGKDERIQMLLTEEENFHSKTTSAQEEQQQILVIPEQNDENKEPLLSMNEVQTSTMSPDQPELKEEFSVITEEQISKIGDDNKEDTVLIATAPNQQTESISQEWEIVEAVVESVEQHSPITSTEHQTEERKSSSLQEYSIPASDIEESGKEVGTHMQEQKLFNEQEISLTTTKETTVSISSQHDHVVLSEEQQQTVSIAPQFDSSMTNEVLQSTVQKSDEDTILTGSSEHTEATQEKTELLTHTVNDLSIVEDISKTSLVKKSTKKTRKHVTWDEAVVDNKEDESSADESLTEDSSSSESSMKILNEEDKDSAKTGNEGIVISESKINIDQVIPSEQQTIQSVSSTESATDLLIGTSQHTNLTDSVVPSEQKLDETDRSVDQTNLNTNTIEQQLTSSDSIDVQIQSSSPLETSATFSDSTAQQTICSSCIETQIDHDERQVRSISPADSHSASTTDSSKEDTYTLDEISTTTSSDPLSNEDISKPVENFECIDLQTKEEEQSIHSERIDETASSQAPDIGISEVKTSALDDTVSFSSPTTTSPIQTLTDNIINRYISRDVYHGYLGEHKHYFQNILTTDNDDTIKPNLVSLQESVSTASISPIETIESSVSNIQTITTVHPANVESELPNHSQDGVSLATAPVIESKEDVKDHGIDIEVTMPVLSSSEAFRNAFENIHEIITTPITAITEIIQEESQPNLSLPMVEQTSSISEIERFVPELHTSLATIETIDAQIHRDLNQDIHSDTIASVKECQIIEQEKSEDEIKADQRSSSTLGDIDVVTSTESDRVYATDSPSLASVDTTISTMPPTFVNTQHENQETISGELPISNIQEYTSTVQKTEETIHENIEPTSAMEQTEQLTTLSSETIEQPNICQKEETILIESSSSDVHSIPSIEQKPETNKLIHDHADASLSSTMLTDHDKQLLLQAIPTVFEQYDTMVQQNTIESQSEIIHKSIEIPKESQASDADVTLADEAHNIVTSSVTESTLSSEQQTSLPTIVETITDVNQNTVQNLGEPLSSNQVSIIDELDLSVKDRSQNEQQMDSAMVSTEQKISDEKLLESSMDRVSTSEANQDLVQMAHNVTNDIINNATMHLSQISMDDEQIDQMKSVSDDSTFATPIATASIQDNIDRYTSISEMTWSSLLGEKSSNEQHEQSLDEMKRLLEEVVHGSDNITVEITDHTTTIQLPSQKESTVKVEELSEQTTIIPETQQVEVQLNNDIESHSTLATTEIEQIPTKSSTDFHEPSPTNTDDDSLELLHALQGHSIVVSSIPSFQIQTTTANQSSTSTSSPERLDLQQLPAPEKSSSSTTTSSQITSSDRYVSYAIHEMGDSSQERLPELPIAADLPVYESTKTASDENPAQPLLSVAVVNVGQVTSKDDDLTELDATENLTYSDDVNFQKQYPTRSSQKEKQDASSTDEDVDDENFNEYETNDTSNLARIVDEITQHSDAISRTCGPTYQRYDISSGSSTSTKPTTDDVYVIPGYAGLWRPSINKEDSQQQSTGAATITTRTTVRTITDPVKFQSLLQQQQQHLSTQDASHPPDKFDIFNRPLNEFSFDISESDSFKTCASTINSSSISKQQKQSELFTTPILEQEEYQITPDENIFLIRERERGVSLPVTMKIDCDNMALRLSASTPIDAALYASATQNELPSSTTSPFSEPLQTTTSNSRGSTPSLSSNESEKHKISSTSWLNTTNTTVATTDGPNGPLESRTTIQKSAKGPISIAECDAQGKYILIENTSRSKSIVLSGWIIRQESDNGDILTYTLPDNCLLRPNHSLKVFSKSFESERKTSDLVASALSSWYAGSNFVTKLINAEGKDRASLTKKTVFS